MEGEWQAQDAKISITLKYQLQFVGLALLHASCLPHTTATLPKDYHLLLLIHVEHVVAPCAI